MKYQPQNFRPHGLLYAVFLLGLLITGTAQAAWTQVDSLTGGDVTALVRDSSGNIYAATDGGGIFKSSDSGQNWSSVNNGLPSHDLHVRSMAMDSSGNLYAGGFASYGLFKSTDGGQNWTHLPAINGTVIDLTVTVLHIDSNDTVFASDRGERFYRSTDGGSTWSLVSGLSYVYAITSTGSAHFAVTFARGVYTSTDGGLSWSYVSSLPSASNTQATAMVADGSNLYVSTEKKQKGWNTANVGIYKSTDSGTNWTAMTTGLTDGNNEGYEVFALSVAGTDTLYGTAMSVSDGDHRIIASSDGGSNWSTIGLPMVKGLALLTSGSEIWAGMQDSGVHYRNSGGSWSWRNSGLTAVHVESLLGTASGSLIVGSSDIGITKSTDNGSNWTTGLLRPNSVIGDMVEDASGNLYAGTDGYDSRSSNVLFKSTDGGDTWTAANSGIPFTDVNALEIDSTGTLYAGTYPNGIYRSTDGAASWVSIAAGYNVFTPAELLVTTADELLTTGGNNRLASSSNQGQTWGSITTSARDTQAIYQDNAGNLYAYSGRELYKSSDGGSVWSIVLSVRSEPKTFLDDGAGTLYFSTHWPAMNGVIYSSTDGGNNWSDASAGLANTEVLSLMVAANGTVYAGTNGGGLYRMAAGTGGSGSTDTTKPVVSPPSNITVAANSASGTPASNTAIAAFLAGATATDDVAVVGNISHDAPTTFPAGTTTTVTFSASDAAGNTGTATATVTVSAFSGGSGNSNNCSSGWCLTITGTVTTGGFAVAIPPATQITGLPDSAVPTASNSGNIESQVQSAYGSLGTVSDFQYKITSSSSTQVVATTSFDVAGTLNASYNLTYTYDYSGSSVSGGGSGGSTGGSGSSSSSSGGGGAFGLPGLLAMLFAALGLRTRRQRRLSTPVLALATIGLLQSGAAQAVPIRFDFTGTVTNIPSNGVFAASGANYGDSFSGWYTFESSITDSNTDVNRGQYTYNSLSGMSLTINIGNFTLSTDPTQPNSSIRVLHWPSYDEYRFNTTLSAISGSSRLFLDAPFVAMSGGVLSSDALPLTPPDLSALAFNEVLINNTDGGQFSGEFTSLTLGNVGTGGGSMPVPAPASWLLMLAGLAGLGLRSRKPSANDTMQYA